MDKRPADWHCGWLRAMLLNKVATVLFSLHDSPEGQAMLARIPLSRFEAANDATYGPVRDFIEIFSNTVRPVNP